MKPLNGHAKRRPDRNRTALIEHMLTEVEMSLMDRDRHNEFIDSLREQFSRTDDLSDKQVEALLKFYERVS